MIVTDPKELQEILEDPSVFFTAKDDGVSTETNYEELLKAAIWVSPSKGVLFGYIPRNYITYEIHVAIIKDKRKGAIKYAHQACEYIFDNTPCQKLITHIPENNKNSIIYAKVCGMTYEGTSPKSFLQDGKLLDCVLLGGTKEDFYNMKEVS